MQLAKDATFITFLFIYSAGFCHYMTYKQMDVIAVLVFMTAIYFGIRLLIIMTKNTLKSIDELVQKLKSSKDFNNIELANQNRVASMTNHYFLPSDATPSKNGHSLSVIENERQSDSSKTVLS